MNQKNEKAEMASEEVREIINYRPGWLIRHGNAFFLLILLTMFILASFVRYPDVIKGSMTLVAVDAPKLLVAKTEGKLEKLLIRNGDQVVKDQPLAFLQSIARHQQVLDLRKWIAEDEEFVSGDSLEEVMAHPLKIYNELGEIQPDYQDFQTVLKESLQLLANGYYQQKMAALKKDIYFLQAKQVNTKAQLQLSSQDYQLQQQEYNANESLAKDKVIAPLELNQSKSRLLGKKENVEQISTQLLNDEVDEHNKEKEIMELQKNIIDLKQKLRSSFFSLKIKVDEWVQQYVVLAPEDGEALYKSFLQENQFVSMGQELFYIRPRSNSFFGQMAASQTGLGKIKINQRVLIRIESYPSAEFGYVTGRVGYISDIPGKGDSFLIRINLPDGLTTNYRKTITFKNDLIAQAEVLTDNRRLVQRFLGGLEEALRR